MKVTELRIRGLDPEIQQALKIMAVQKNTNVNALMIEILTAYVKASK